MLEDSHLLNPYLFCLFLSVVKRVLKSLNCNWGFLILHSFLFCSMYFQALLLVRAHSGICVILMNGLLLSSWNYPLYLCPQAFFRMLIRPMQLSCNYCSCVSFSNVFLLSHWYLCIYSMFHVESIWLVILSMLLYLKEFYYR